MGLAHVETRQVVLLQTDARWSKQIGMARRAVSSAIYACSQVEARFLRQEGATS